MGMGINAQLGGNMKPGVQTEETASLRKEEKKLVSPDPLFLTSMGLFGIRRTLRGGERSILQHFTRGPEPARSKKNRSPRWRRKEQILFRQRRETQALDEGISFIKILKTMLDTISSNNQTKWQTPVVRDTMML